LGDTVTIDDDGGGGGDDDSVKVIVWMSLSLSAPSDDDIPRTVRFFFFQFGMDFFVDTSSSFSFKGNWSSFYLFILYFILKRQKLEPSPRDIDIYSTFDFVFLVSFLLCTISYLCLRCTCFPPLPPCSWRVWYCVVFTFTFSSFARLAFFLIWTFFFFRSAFLLRVFFFHL